MPGPPDVNRVDRLIEIVGACRRRLVLAIAVAFVLVIAARPINAQSADAATARWIIQGGPMAGISFLLTEQRQFEAGLRLGARRGTRVVDLSLSTFQVEARRLGLPTVRQRIFDALAGVTWQPGALGIGFRTGFAIPPANQGKPFSILAFGPHHLLAIPIAQRLDLRAEAGVHLYYDRTAAVIGAPRAFIRVGLERRSQ